MGFYLFSQTFPQKTYFFAFLFLTNRNVNIEMKDGKMFDWSAPQKGARGKKIWNDTKIDSWKTNLQIESRERYAILNDE